MNNMVETTTRKWPLKLIIVLTIVGAIMLAMSISMAKTSTTDYCISCHEIRTHKDELDKSIHAVDKDKNPIQCRQCHIPNSIGPKYLLVKTVLGLKDLIAHNFGDPENLDRREMQKIARQFMPDENCLACHSDLTQDTKGKELSEIGQLCHEAYQGKNGETKRRCAGCHFNIAHLPTFDRRYSFNSEFAKRLPLKQEPTP
jgi:nitrate/TMAO reductase-like tetraheme cytochrome c subunit